MAITVGILWSSVDTDSGFFRRGSYLLSGALGALLLVLTGVYFYLASRESADSIRIENDFSLSPSQKHALAILLWVGAATAMVASALLAATKP